MENAKWNGKKGRLGELHARKMFSKKVIARDAAAAAVPGNRNKFLHGVVFSRGRGGNDGYTGGC